MEIWNLYVTPCAFSGRKVIYKIILWYLNRFTGHSIWYRFYNVICRILRMCYLLVLTHGCEWRELGKANWEHRWVTRWDWCYHESTWDELAEYPIVGRIRSRADYFRRMISDKRKPFNMSGYEIPISKRLLIEFSELSAKAQHLDDLANRIEAMASKRGIWNAIECYKTFKSNDW